MFFKALLRWHRSRIRRLTVSGLYKEALGTLGWFILVSIVHIWVMWEFEDKSLFDAWWLTYTTFSTVGYGDMSAATAFGRVTTVVLGYFIGVGLLATLVGHAMAIKSEIRLAFIRGIRYRKWVDHFVILGSPKMDDVAYLKRLLDEMSHDADYVGRARVLVSNSYPDGLPDGLRERGLELVSKDPTTMDALHVARVNEARAVLVLASDAFEPASDGPTDLILKKLQRIRLKGRVVVEAVDASNRAILRRQGERVNQPVSVVRPLRVMPEVTAAAIITPGLEVLIDEMVDQKGEHVVRANIICRHMTWEFIRERLRMTGIGRPIAYVDPTKRYQGSEWIERAVMGDKVVDATALFILMNDGVHKSDAEIAAVLGSEASPLMQQVIDADAPIVILGRPAYNGDGFLLGLVKELDRHPDFRLRHKLLVSDSYPDGLPKSMKDHGITLVAGNPTDRDVLTSAKVQHAHTVFITARNAFDKSSDGRTVLIMDILANLGTTAQVVVEAVDDDNRGILRAQGNVLIKNGARMLGIVRPVRNQSELAAAAIISPGFEVIYEDLVTRKGCTIVRIDFGATSLDGMLCQLNGRRLRKFVEALVGGTVIAAVDGNKSYYGGEWVIQDIDGAKQCDLKAIYVMFPPDTADINRRIAKIKREHATLRLKAR